MRLLYFLLLFLCSFSSVLLGSAQSFRSSFKVDFDYRFLDTSSSDVDVISGYPMSCPGLPAIPNEVYAGGKSSGLDCYDGAGTLQYSDNCRLICNADETVTAAAVVNLKLALSTLASVLQNSPLEVRADESQTISFTSNLASNCDGLRVLTPVTVTNTDLLVFVTARPLRQLGIPNLFAMSTFCAFHSSTSNRVSVARLNIDPSLLNKYSSDLAFLKTLVAKEFVHTLGFSPSLMPSSRHPSDVTKTYYQFDSTLFPTGPVAGLRVTALPSPPGNFTFGAKTTSKIHFFGPATAAVASIFFNCSSIKTTTGVELENGGDPMITVANLEKRLFPSEMMIADWNGTQAKTPAQLYSLSLTLSLLHDTGFYSVPQFRGTNLTALLSNNTITLLSFGSNFGQGLGCTFVTGRCIPDWPLGYTCDSLGGGCSALDEMGQCDIKNYPSPLPTAYQYFSDPNQAGGDKYMDFCPRFSPVPNGDCKVNSNPSNPLITQSGMYFGSNSKCAISRVVKSGFTAPAFSYPSCFGVLCGFPGQAVSFFTVGNEELVKCSASNELVELFPPPRANVYSPPLQLAGIGSTVIHSYSWHGQIACSNIPAQCQADASSAYPHLSQPLANITRIHPSWSKLDGDVEIAVYGTNLTGCNGLRIGGVAVASFVVRNDSTILARSGRVPASGVEGGEGLDAQGNALVQLICPIPALAASHGICTSNKGCIVGRWNGLFTYSDTDPHAPPPPPPEKTFFDFFKTVGGKLLGVFLSLMTTVFLGFLVRKGMNYFHGVVDETTFAKKEGESDDDFDETDEEPENLSITSRTSSSKETGLLEKTTLKSTSNNRKRSDSSSRKRSKM